MQKYCIIGGCPWTSKNCWKLIFTWAQQEPTLNFACWPCAKNDTNTRSLPRTRTPTDLLKDRKIGCRAVEVRLRPLQLHRRTLAPAWSKHWPPDLFKDSLLTHSMHIHSVNVTGTWIWTIQIYYTLIIFNPKTSLSHRNKILIFLICILHNLHS